MPVAIKHLAKYFRKHPWQRRMLSFSVAVVVGVSLALLAGPWVQDMVLIHRMGSNNPDLQLAAIQLAVERGRKSPSTVRRLDSALDTEDDEKFDAIAEALNRLGCFFVPSRSRRQIDRFWANSFQTTSSADTRLVILKQIIVGGAGNEYVLRAGRIASNNGDKRIRALASIAAALCRDEQTLAKLLADDDDMVKASAILDAGLAGCGELVVKFAGQLMKSENLEVASSAAWALHTTGGDASGWLADCKREKMRDRLLYVMSLSGDNRDAVRKVILECQKSRRIPSAMALLAAGRLKVTQADKSITDTLTRAMRRRAAVSESQVLAALQAADSLDLNVAELTDNLCKKLWGPRHELTMISAASLLAKANEKYISTLRRASTYSAVIPASGGKPARTVTTPLASASAAVGLWLLSPSAGEIKLVGGDRADMAAVLKIDRQSSALYVRIAAANASTLAGDYIAWHIGRSGHEKAFALGLAMLPELDAPAHLRVYNDNERSAGAMLLALSAKTASQRKLAAARINSRLKGGSMGGEDSAYVAGAYRCALLILGECDIKAVRNLLDTGEFPQRRAITALLAVGDKEVMDSLLWGANIDSDDLVFLLINKSIGEVIRAMVKGSPIVEPTADTSIRRWQVKILRHWYAINRNSIVVGAEK